MRVLVIGGGGREHAIVAACTRHGHEVLCTPANPGIARQARVLHSPQDAASLARLAQQEAVDLVIVGPEAYLAAGVVDACTALGIPAFGPTQAASRLEGDKAWSKAFMARHGIPTAQHLTFDNLEDALAHVRGLRTPIVVKDAGLKAGKGVTIAHSHEEAGAALRDIFSEAGAKAVIEDFMTGQEVTILALTDGVRYALTPPSQDHKTIYEGDTGPMTGGMGVICPFPVPDDALSLIRETIIIPTLRGMEAEGVPFRGVLYAGLMLTPQGPKVVEFNARFGDPEAEAVLPLLASDLAQHALEAAQGRLDPDAVQFQRGASAVVILAAPGYPAEPVRDIPITLPPEPSGTAIFHAGTRQDGEVLRSNGGRVLAVTATATTLQEALSGAYSLADQIDFPGAQMRRDIGHRIGLAPGAEV
ncbi:phosphoribosylamine--glycine ligase [Deinococcus deserti]|uniref:Phosphoribosylamine--glycine ligase n=1 Tax=Deinococcus deserti (strain DSM 17065 / CIP 109153 / LMG 22923 / VCD115) TaxID=546414 RepID=C1CUY4_DEIDV|nr:phosphoribosylamine--glycine ligase [Deinococcus deserti]ACO46001.1 putative phosphoribosylamine--glycine ligase (Glycinamide ribonucleotide synthetase) (phosphoribosylglycinamide synthetase) [Deinococcus deserti VCD115]